MQQVAGSASLGCTQPTRDDAMQSQSDAMPVLVWPPPPARRFAVGAPEALCACRVECIDGRHIEGLLVDFDADASAVNLWPDGESAPLLMALERIRCIRLTAPASCVIDPAGSPSADRAREDDAQTRTFRVTFHQGEPLSGITLGFVRGVSGLFLYLTDAGAVTAVNCFVPAHGIDAFEIGQAAGQELPDPEPADVTILARTLRQQTLLRDTKTARYLAQRAISTSDDLIRALHAQGNRPNARLGDILVEAGAISSEQLEQALAQQTQHRGRRLGDILVDLGAVSVRLIQVALSDKLGIPYVAVRDFPIGLGVLETISTAYAIRHQVLPLLQTSNSLIVAVENPLAVDFLQELRFQTGLSLDPVIADPQELKERISKEYSGLDNRLALTKTVSGGAGLIELRGSAESSPFQTNVADLTTQLARESKASNRSAKEVQSDQRVSENTLVRLVNKIIIEAHAQGASDIHIESNAGHLQTRIRFRKDGDLEDYLELPQAYSNSLVSRIKIMAELDISERRHPQDGKIDFAKHGPLPIELRVAVIPTANNLEDVVLRILSGAEALPLDQIGFSNTDLASLRKMISRSFGLILVCGPTGSGKTTTLHSLLRDINRPDLKIWTAEDPVEITQRGLRQVQVNSKIDWTFAAAMRAFLRADPDVIMVGEMRDAETTKIAIEASLTGHLVFSTLHTNSAAESVVRLLDLGMDPFNFADALIGVLSQRLARKLCPTCKQGRVATHAEIAELVDEYCDGSTLDPAEVLSRWQAEFWREGRLVLREAVGCEACKEGYKGRVVVYELLNATLGVKHLVRSKAAVPQIQALAQQEGMLSLRQQTLHHVLRGTLDLTSARAVSS
jgi:type II secretory ATPase GspE/PulE/Tfp pilus assembly ATPase PilB-like protein